MPIFNKNGVIDGNEGKLPHLQACVLQKIANDYCCPPKDGREHIYDITPAIE